MPQSTPGSSKPAVGRYNLSASHKTFHEGTKSLCWLQRVRVSYLTNGKVQELW